MKAQHETSYKSLPILLKQMRMNAGLTQRDLAKLINKRQQFVYLSENSIRRIDITEFVVWAKACGVNPKTAFANLLKEME